MFDVADRWDVLLLLDEADLFLRQQGDDQQHNSLVGVSEVIMVLITNGVRDFDTAVQSRGGV